MAATLADYPVDLNEDNEEIQELISAHFETLDAQEGEDGIRPDYLIFNVAIGPPFVKCEECGTMHATELPKGD